VAKFKGLVFAQFSPNFDISVLILRLYESKYAGNDSWLSIIMICLISLWLCKFFLPFWKANFCLFHQFFSKVYQKLIKDCKSQKYCWIYRASCWTAYIESHRLRIKRKKYQNLDKKWAKQLWILTLFIWGCWGCLRSKKFQMVDQL
jgi:hypothetical protein